MQQVAKNLIETGKIAKLFLDKVLKAKRKHETNALVIGLSGDLGAGKTAFVKEIGKHLGIVEKIHSPTFIIMKRYELKRKKFAYFYHIDAYRLKSEDEILSLGWHEIVNDPENLIFIEWPENISKIIPKGAHVIYISTNEKGIRKFRLK
jgi:tRNA threonylcarbamoyladenosine biosynthesis protein TsaE